MHTTNTSVIAFHCRIVGKIGPTHACTYKVNVYFRGKRLGQGEGRSVHKAEFDAAANALEQHKSRFCDFYSEEKNTGNKI